VGSYLLKKLFGVHLARTTSPRFGGLGQKGALQKKAPVRPAEGNRKEESREKEKRQSKGDGKGSDHFQKPTKKKGQVVARK